MKYSEEWFRSNADATPRRCSCGKTFSIRDDYPWNYFLLKGSVRRGSIVNTCPECEADMVVQAARSMLQSRVRQVVRDEDRALLRFFGRDLDGELNALF